MFTVFNEVGWTYTTADCTESIFNYALVKMDDNGLLKDIKTYLSVWEQPAGSMLKEKSMKYTKSQCEVPV